jgi:FAD/FMN-containing dehydrogenase
MVLPVHAGDLEAGQAAMAPFRALATPLMDMVGPMPYVGMYELTAGASQAAPEVVRSAFLGGFDEAAAEAIVAHHRSPAAVASISQLRVLGGAMARVPSGATAFAHRDAPVMATFMNMVAGSREEAVADTDALLAAVSGAATGVYANFLGVEAPERIHQAYPRATYERLVAVKRRVDPRNVFHANHNIRP